MVHKVATKKTRVAVLMGGPSNEHEVSLNSGEHVLEALNPKMYDAVGITINKQGEWETPIETLANKVDIAFIALHGTYGEDGTIQGELESAHLPYTGSRSLASALAMNKFLSQRLLRDNGILTPRSFHIAERAWEQTAGDVCMNVRHYLGYPVVVKPNDNGSSVGISIAHNRNELIVSMDKAFEVSNSVIVEEFIPGREVTCGVLDYGWSESAFPLLPTSIVPRGGSSFFDYKAKYDENGAHEITPPFGCKPHQIHSIQRTAVRAHQLLGCRGFSRTDFILKPNGELTTLEVNTIPGLTKQSLFPKAAHASGLPFSKALDVVVKAAFYRA